MAVKNMGNETLARVRIDNTLVALGWRLDGDRTGPADVRMEGDVKSPRDKARLKGKRPDYILYDGDEIVGLIEAKKNVKGGKTVADGIAQCMEYARMLGRKNAICFCADGNITQACHASGAAVKINGELVDELLPLHQVAALAKNPNLDLGDEISNIGQLINLFHKSADILRNDGVEAGLDSLREFCLLLFIKVMTEKGASLPGCGWDELVDKNGEDLMVAYQRIISDYQRKYRDIFRDAAIRRPETLKSLIDGISGINFSRSDMDIKGGAYEHFLAKFNTGKRSVLGQYFTPRHITRMLAKLMDFRLNETIYDPFCGTGGMLIACYTSLRNQARTLVEKAHLNNKTLFGRDITPTAAQLAKMNMVLLGDGHTNISRTDSYMAFVENKYDAVITNIPFGLDSRDRETADMYLGATGGNSDEIGALHCIHAVKPGGRAAIILPENLAYLERHRKFRAFIAKNASIRAVIRLPRHTFKPYTTARTFVLLLENIWKGGTKRFPFAELRQDGFSDSAWREPINDNDIPELLAAAGDIGGHYGEFISARADSWFPAQKNADNGEESHALKDLLVLTEQKTPIHPDKLYKEPKLNSADNTAKPRGSPRLGRNIRAAAKIIAEPGDLIIATLHTQSGNGLFAFADDYYVCTSQIVAKVREDLVDKNYLRLMLRRELPKIVVNDLVGRETVGRDVILGIRIPKTTGKRRKMIERYISLGKQRDEIEREMREIEEKIVP